MRNSPIFARNGGIALTRGRGIIVTLMSTSLISIRTARGSDAPDIAHAHQEAWRHAYQGVIPHLPLSRMIARRGAGWWRDAIERGLHALVLDFDGELAGYATLGRSRLRGTRYRGEIFELYVRPAYQGVGFGKRLFTTARAELAARNLDGLCVWSLAENDRACAFYLHLGGQPVSEGVERFGDASLRKVAFAWR
jgi:ribosomal protein S18 acetylase RimI-like enzyme